MLLARKRASMAEPDQVQRAPEGSLVSKRPISRGAAGADGASGFGVPPSPGEAPLSPPASR